MMTYWIVNRDKNDGDTGSRLLQGRDDWSAVSDDQIRRRECPLRAYRAKRQITLAKATRGRKRCRANTGC
jgi:hypothetical protein